MSDYVPHHVQACLQCLARKSPNNRREPMGHVPAYSKWERVAMDILDITTVSDKGNRYILVVADYFTKYTEAYPLPDKSARSVADMLVDRWMTKYGFPLTLHSDQGREFENRVIHDISRLMGSVRPKLPHIIHRVMVWWRDLTARYCRCCRCSSLPIKLIGMICYPS